MNLIVVESPTKARTLGGFLGKDYQVIPTVGHVRDLPKRKLGVDVEHDFAPTYEVVPGREKQLQAIKQFSNKAMKVYLATDPDREGEAIAWHVGEILRDKDTKILSESKAKKTPNILISQYPNIQRIVFHEITREAVNEALSKPREIDMNLVDAQQARRVLDRVVGYKLSPLLWRKVRRGLSAGRVQSVAVRLIVEREREIEKFQGENYWRIYGAFIARGGKDIFVAELVGCGNEKFQKSETFKLFAGTHAVTQTTIKNGKQAEELILAFGEKFVVSDIEEKEILRRPPAPFITSTLQQTAYRRLHLTSGQTMRLAQKLYENGLITYHRTDSTNLASSAVSKIRQFVGKEFGEKYLPKTPNFFRTKSKVAQEAHEAIRPTDVGRTGVRGEGARLYDLIWKQAVASQMAPAIVEETRYEIRDTKEYEFEANGMRMLFDGWMRVGGVPKEDDILPKLAKNDEVIPDTFCAAENSTNPPPRYTDASLIGALEREGIGRPSTYAPTISTIQTRQYVEKEEGRFRPTPVGEATNDFLVGNFPDVFELPFTAKMEDDLDEIANGKVKWVPVIKDFWEPFEKKLEIVGEKAKRVKIEVEKTGEKCPECKVGEQVVRVGRFGKFLSCSTFPECDWTEQFVEKIDMKCPGCGRGEVIIRKTKRGKKFFGCSEYPKCKWASWKSPKPLASQGETPSV